MALNSSKLQMNKKLNRSNALFREAITAGYDEDGVPRKDFINWDAYRPQLSEEDTALNDWFAAVGLNTDEDYTIDSTVNKVHFGLGWDPSVDIDASAVMFDDQKKLYDKVWWQKLMSNCGSIVHSGDNLTGKGEGDDEVITVDMERIPYQVNYILFAVCMFTRGSSLDGAKHAYVRMLNGSDPSKKDHVMCRYDLKTMSGTAMLIGLMSRKRGTWTFKALGQPATGRTIVELVKRTENLRVLYETPSYSPVRKMIKVKVLRGRELAAKNLAIVGRASSDPYYIIKYKGRKYQSEHLVKSVNPEWEVKTFDLLEVTESEYGFLVVEVYDKQMIGGDNFMGMIRVSAKELCRLPDGDQTFWFTLQPLSTTRKPKAVAGMILISFEVNELSSEDLEKNEHQFII